MFLDRFLTRRARDTSSDLITRDDAPGRPRSKTVEPRLAQQDQTALILPDEVLTAPGGSLAHLNPNIAGVLALVRDAGQYSFYVRSNMLGSSVIEQFIHAAQAQLKTSLPEPIPTTHQQIRGLNVAQADRFLGNGATAIRSKLKNLIDRGAVIGTNDMKMDIREGMVTVRFQTDGSLSKEDQRFHMTEEEAHALITSAFSYADDGDPFEQPDRAQRLTIVDPAKLPPGVQCIRGQTAPLINGRRLVLRFIYKTTKFSAATLSDLGFLPIHLGHLDYSQYVTAGIVSCVAGTGNGKSTTLQLYCIDMVKAADGHIDAVGIDDTVEFMAPEIVQLALREVADGGDPFAEAFNTTLRIDPHVVKIGEARSAETLNTAYRAANGDKLVLITMHTHSAFEVPRKSEMTGVDPKIAYDPAMHVCWISQRLIPTLCPHCRINARHLPLDLPRRRRNLVRRFKAILDKFPNEQFYIRGPGCRACERDNGGQGGLGKRVLAAEVIMPDRQLCKLLANEDEEGARRYAIIDQRTPTLPIHAFLHMRAGKIGLEEFMRAGTPARLLADLEALEEAGYDPQADLAAEAEDVLEAAE